MAILALILSITLGQVPPQAPPGLPATGRLRVFLDCDCYQTYLREELDWVDYVRQAQDADVHVLSSSTDTGGGGKEIVLRFVGRSRFTGVDQELKVVMHAGDTDDAERRAILKTVSVGLLGYMARTGLASGVDVDVSVEARAAAGARPQRDRWNLWAFETRVSGGFDAEESRRNREGSLRFSADRVSEAWKFSFGARASQQVESFTLEPDEDEPGDVGQTITTRRRESSVEGLVVKSLGPHWSIGAGGDVNSSSFGNTRLRSRVAPAIEYSIFPYREHASRQFVAFYRAGVERVKYFELTLFDKLEETLPFHEATFRADQERPWGSLNAEVSWRQYLHDASKYRISVDGEVDIRITRGLSVSFDWSASRIRDQLSLPKRNADPSEVLLRLRELRSGYEVDFSFGITYNFGSLFNNVVNPRFGG